MAAQSTRRRQIAGEEIVKRRDVGRALDGGMSTQREDAATGPADVAQEKLQYRGRPDHLHADGMLRPADRVADRAGLVRPRVGEQRIGDLSKSLGRRAANLLDQLRRVALIMAAQNLIDTALVSQRQVLMSRRADKLTDELREILWLTGACVS